MMPVLMEMSCRSWLKCRADWRARSRRLLKRDPIIDAGGWGRGLPLRPMGSGLISQGEARKAEASVMLTVSRPDDRLCVRLLVS